MHFEAILFGLVLAAAAVPLVARLRRRWLGIAGTLVLALAVALPAATAWSAWKSRSVRQRLALDSRPIEVSQDGYVSSRTCRACHPSQYATWHASFHRTMTQFASPETVVAPFRGEEIVADEGTYRMERRGDEFWVAMPDPAWRGDPAARPRVEKRIVMLTGSHHYQVYWYPSGNPRVVWVLPYIWQIEDQRWIPRGAAFLGPEERTKDILGVWNNSCIKCHSTRGRPGPRPGGEMDTRVAEIGIACEACHGPAQDHVLRHRNPRQRYRHHLDETPDGTIVQPERLSHRAAAQVCGQCHGVWQHDGQRGWRAWLDDGLTYRPGEDLSETVRVVRPKDDSGRLREGYVDRPGYRMERQFWRDGMVRVSGREYNGLLDTPCFQRGELTCTTCHRLHVPDGDPRPLAAWKNDQLGLGMDGDAACYDCHPSYEQDPTRHTHHAPESSGSRCYNCHMPYTTYGLLKAIRSHEIDSPTVEASLRTGRPNACNQCHLDQTLQWTAGYLNEWYELPAPRLPPEHQSVAASVIWTLTGDAGQRALMAWSLGWEDARDASGTDWMAPYLARLLDDPYQAVRLIAHRSLRTLPGFEDVEYDAVGPLEHRRVASRQVLELWRQHAATAPDGARRDAVLLVRPGVLREELFYPLMARRDERVVELHE